MPRIARPFESSSTVAMAAAIWAGCWEYGSATNEPMRSRDVSIAAAAMPTHMSE